MKLTKPIWIIRLIFCLVVCISMIFSLLYSGNATIGEKRIASEKRKSKQCSCCDKLQDFEKRFTERKTRGEFSKGSDK